MCVWYIDNVIIRPIYLRSNARDINYRTPATLFAFQNQFKLAHLSEHQ